MRGLHAAFTQSIKAEATCTGRVANIVEAGNDREAAADACTESIRPTTTRQKHWRTEIPSLLVAWVSFCLLVMKVGVQAR